MWTSRRSSFVHDLTRFESYEDFFRVQTYLMVRGGFPYEMVERMHPMEREIAMREIRESQERGGDRFGVASAIAQVFGGGKK